MKKYPLKFFCRNGEVVFGRMCNQNLYIYYKGEEHKRGLESIGKTLFEYDPIVKIGFYVEILEQDSKEILRVQLFKPETEIKYHRMGGSFYGASATEEIMLNKPLKNENGIRNLSIHSPLGEALLNHRINELIRVKLPNDKTKDYRIINIKDKM